MSVLARKVARRKGLRTHLTNDIDQHKACLGDDESSSQTKLAGLKNSLDKVIDQLQLIDEDI